MNLDAGQLRELQKVARGKWNKLSKYRQQEMQDLGVVALDDYGSPTITIFGNQALKENP